MSTLLTCKLTYFKRTGKFYDEGSFDVPETMSLHEIWDMVRAKKNAGQLPGLVEGAGREFIVSVNVPGHRHEHPHLVV